MTSKNAAVSLMVALLFGIHPLNVESVAWVSERKGLLSSFFFLGACMSYLYYLKQGRALRFYFFSLVLFVFSLLSKAMAVTLPFILLTLDAFLYKNRAKVKLKDKIPFFAISLAFIIITFFSHYSGEAVKERTFDLLAKISTASYCVIFYLYKIFVPINLSSLYPFPSKSMLFISPILAAILFVFIIWLSRYSKKIIFGATFFLITIIPALQFIPVGKAVVADRYIYLASIGIFYLVSEFFRWAYFKNTRYQRILRFILIIFLLTFLSGLSLLTYTRTKVWKDSVSLWTDALKNHASALAYNMRGVGYKNKGELDRAISDFSAAIKINPRDVQPYINRSLVYIKKGNLDQALFDSQKALRINPRLPEVYNIIGNINMAKKEYGPAIFNYTKAINMSPYYAEAYYNRGCAYQDKKDFERALLDYAEAIKINPYYAEPYLNRGSIYFSRGDFSRALSDYNAAIKINPNSADAYYNRAVAYQSMGDFDRAISDYAKVITINADYALAYYNRAVIYFNKSKYKESWSDINKAIGLGYAIDLRFLELLKKASGRQN
ncbi:MAG: tetratricopeptide repeat protein [Candidatus Omnitrophota bacterium]